MQTDLVRVPVTITHLAHAKAAALAKEAGWKRDHVLWFTIRDYLTAEDPESAPERVSAEAITHALLERQLKGTRAVKRPRYLVPKLCDDPTVEPKHMWQVLPPADAKLLRKLPAYYGVTLSDLAVAAILWATGADEPAADGSNVFAPKAKPAAESAPDPLDLLRAGGREKLSSTHVLGLITW